MRILALVAALCATLAYPGNAAERQQVEHLVALVMSGYESNHVDIFTMYRNRAYVEFSMEGTQVSVTYERQGPKVLPRPPFLKIVVDRHVGHSLNRMVVEDEDADGDIDVGYAIHQPPYPAVRPDDFFIRSKHRCLYRKHRKMCGPQGGEREAAWQKKYDELVTRIVEHLSR